MTVFQFSCKCGARLVSPGKVRPVCRTCGKQMRLAGKVAGRVMYAQIEEFNRRFATAGKP
jgi:hypothetical protein